MKQWNRKTGMLAEELAVRELENQGYCILKRNFCNKYGEIDIIAKDKHVTVFVEVKAKIGTDFGLPEEMISKRKLEKIRNMATIYTKGESIPCRIDVVAIVLNSAHEILRITHYQNVF
jgi:putative endonuclease